MANLVYQFKITLNEVSPPIWRRILVPQSYDFWALHVAIQDAMGWTDSHLHQFTIRRKHAREAVLIGRPDEDRYDDEPETLPGWRLKVSDYFTDIGWSADYAYDFGDNWHHEVLLEGILLKDKTLKYPQCIDGERACPPEDCGGIDGYYRLLTILSDPEHEEHDAMVEWAGEDYDPHRFVPDEVKFDIPGIRWNYAFLHE